MGRVFAEDLSGRPGCAGEMVRNAIEKTLDPDRGFERAQTAELGRGKVGRSRHRLCLAPGRVPVTLVSALGDFPFRRRGIFLGSAFRKTPRAFAQECLRYTPAATGREPAFGTSFSI